MKKGENWEVDIMQLHKLYVVNLKNYVWVQVAD